MAAHPHPTHYGSADDPAMKDRDWVFQQWDLAHLKAKGGPGLLVLDEVQKIPDWSEAVKSLWDADSGTGSELRVLLLGSSPLLLQSGLSESLAGRFEVIAAPHWSFAEMQEAFGWDLDTYIFYGGYPGAADLIAGLQKFTHGKIRQRGSSPKLQVLNTALMSANSMMGFAETRANAERWGRMVGRRLALISGILLWAPMSK